LPIMNQTFNFLLSFQYLAKGSVNNLSGYVINIGSSRDEKAYRVDIDSFTWLFG